MARHAVGIHRRVTFHGLRHTMVDLLRQAGVDTFLRRAMVGHESEAMERNYSKIRPHEARAVGEQVLRLLPGGVHSGVHGASACGATAGGTTKKLP